MSSSCSNFDDLSSLQIMDLGWLDHMTHTGEVPNTTLAKLVGTNRHYFVFRCEHQAELYPTRNVDDVTSLQRLNWDPLRSIYVNFILALPCLVVSTCSPTIRYPKTVNGEGMARPTPDLVYSLLPQNFYLMRLGNLLVFLAEA